MAPPLDYGLPPHFAGSGTQTIHVTRVLDIGPWTRSAQERIRTLAELPNGWDDKGSPSISADIREQGLMLIDILTRLGMPEPHIVPVPGGGLQMEWRHNKGELEIELLPDASVGYLIVDRKGRMHAAEISDVNQVYELAPVTCWFLGMKDDVVDLFPYDDTGTYR